ncbi:MAG: hypothetical protein IT561_22050 [Alphaproteobacteria bacterium]|nr:hypothetical protein [Alphaproteobacteria bacterium]
MTAGYDVVFCHRWLDAHPLERTLPPPAAALHPLYVMRIAAAFVARHAPAARIVVLTDDAGRLRGRIPGAVVEERDLGTPETLQLGRTRAYRDFLAEHAAAADGTGAVFLDTDALALRELGPLFERPFDVALTYLAEALEPPPAALDEWGLPTDRRLSAINFGVMAARYGTAAVAFFDAALERFAAIAAAGDSFLSGARNTFSGAGGAAATMRIGDVRTWGGGQFALTSLMSAQLFRGLAPESMVAGARVLLLPDSAWNYSPPPGRFTPDMLEGRWVLHLKGARKAQIGAIAAWFAIG